MGKHQTQHHNKNSKLGLKLIGLLTSVLIGVVLLKARAAQAVSVALSLQQDIGGLG